MKNEISLKLKHFSFFGGGGSGRIATTSTQGMLVGFVLRFFSLYEGSVRGWCM